MLALWLGAMAVVALVVAPRVFRFLDDPQRAGDLMAPVFRAVDLFGIGAAVLCAFLLRRSRWRAVLAACLGAAAAVNAFALAPRIAARAEHFETYHRVSEGLWGFLLVGGLVLLVVPAPRRPA